MYGVGGHKLSMIGESELHVIQIGASKLGQKWCVKDSLWKDTKEDGISGCDFCNSHKSEWKWGFDS